MTDNDEKEYSMCRVNGTYINEIILMKLEKWDHSSKRYRDYVIKGRRRTKGDPVYTALGYFDRATFHLVKDGGEGNSDISMLLNRSDDSKECAMQYMSLFHTNCETKTKYIDIKYGDAEKCGAGYIYNFNALKHNMNEYISNVTTFKFSHTVFDSSHATAPYSVTAGGPEGANRRHTVRVLQRKCIYGDKKCKNVYMRATCLYTKTVNDEINRIKEEAGQKLADLKWACYMSMGSTDITLILCTKNFEMYSKIVYRLWLLTYWEKKPKSGKGRYLLFSDSSTLYLFDRYNGGLPKLYEGIGCSALIRLSSVNCLHNAGLLIKFREYFNTAHIEADRHGEKNRFLKGMHGDEDYMQLFDCGLDEFLRLYIKDGEKIPYFYDKNAMKYIRSVHIELLDDAVCPLNEKEQANVTKAVNRLSRENERLVAYMNSFDELLGIYEKYKHRLPVSIHGTMNKVMQLVNALGNSSSRFAVFKNTQKVLVPFFNALKGSDWEKHINSFIECSQGLYNILPNTFQIDDTEMDGIRDSVSVRPFSKIFIAFEQLICELIMAATENDYDHVNPASKGSSPVMLTVGFGQFAGMVHFRLNRTYKDRVLVFDIPNALFFDLNKSFFPTLHESGHYMERDSGREARNSAVVKAFACHITSRILRTHSEIWLGCEADYHDVLYDVTGFINIESIENIHEKEMECILKNDITKQIKDYLDENRMKNKYVQKYGGNPQAVNMIAAKVDYLSKLLSDSAFIEPFLVGTREARADYMMISCTSMSYTSYIKFMYDVLERNHEKYHDEATVRLRMHIILYYFVFKSFVECDGFKPWDFQDGRTAKDGKAPGVYYSELERRIEELNGSLEKEHFKFARGFSETYKVYEHFVTPMVEYILKREPINKVEYEILANEKQTVCKEKGIDIGYHEKGLLGRLMQFCPVDKLPDKYDIKEQIQFYYSLYFKQMQWLYYGGADTGGHK
jgi:hypothetical protein